MASGDAASFLNSSRALGSRPGLERVSVLCRLLGDPQDSLPTVHVAGTNGKGSTAAMIAAALSAAGHRTGLYTSPYIEDARESMRIDGKCISPGEFHAVAEAVCDKARMMDDGPTSFELETAMAFLWFRQSGCRAAVIEAGLGGRLDATNVIARPAVAVLTSISCDHVNILGNTLRQIAAEKCGILKHGGVAVSFPSQDPEAMAVIREKAAEAGNRLIVPDAASVSVLRAGLDGVEACYGGLLLRTPMAGRHQAMNAATAVEALRALHRYTGFAVTGAAIAEGISRAALPLRQEVLCLSPIVLMDCAHNLDKLTALAGTMREHLGGRRTAVVMGMLRDKDYEPSVELIAGLAGRFVACAPKSDRALESTVTAAIAGRCCADVRVDDDCATALDAALEYAGEEGAVVVCGSFWLAGPVRKLWLERAK